MRKTKLLIFTLLMFIFPLTAHALSGTFSISCPASATPGSTVQCTVTGNSDGIVAGLSSKVVIDGSAIVAGFDRNSSIWKDTDGSLKDDGVTFFTTASGDGSSGSFNIGTLSLTVAENATAGSNITVSLTNIAVCDENDNDYTTGFTGGSATIAVSSGSVNPPAVTEKGLKSLYCSSEGCVLSPQFNSTDTTYGIYLESASITSFAISATAKNSSDEIVFTDSDSGTPLNPEAIVFNTSGGNASMSVTIKVGSGDSLVEYTLIASKPAVGALELSSLVVGDQTIDLIKGKYTYDVVLTDVDIFQIHATVADSGNFTLDDTYLDKDFSDPGGYGIVISPADSTSGLSTQTYVVNVIKQTSGGSSNSGSGNNSGATPSTNPKTGSFSTIVMAAVLILSLFATLYLYKQNMAGYNKK